MKNLFVFYRAENHGGQQIENNFVFDNAPPIRGMIDITTMQDQIAKAGNYRNVRIMFWQRMEVQRSKA